MSEFETGGSSKRMIIAIIVIIVVAGGGIVGFMLMNQTPTTTEPEGKTLNILTRHDVSIQSVYEAAFLKTDYAKEHHITNIEWKAAAAEFWDEIIDAGEADVCWGGGPTLFDQLMRDDRLIALDSPLMQTVAARVLDTIGGADMKRYNGEGDLVWIAAAISTFGFTVNHEFLDDKELPTPHKWTDLANATYGQYLTAVPTIAMGNAPGTTSNTRIYEIITQALGWDAGWINMARMAGNARIYGGSVETQAASENGDVGISMSIDFYGYLSQFRNPDCEYIVPEGQSIVNGDPIAIPINGANEADAEAFLDFVLSPYGQSLWLSDTIRRMPVMGEAFSQPLGLAAPDLYSVYNKTLINVGIDFNDTISLQTNMAFISYWESVYFLAHDELVDCWSAMVDAYFAGDLTEQELNNFANQMGTPVTIIDPLSSQTEKFTLDYATRINNNMIYNDAYKSQVQTAWTNAAKLQYQTVLAAVQAYIA